MKKNIHSLNGLRAISVSMVILYHLNTHHFFSKDGVITHIGSIFFCGAFGVNVFFLISGFLITTLLIQENATYGSISLKNFYLRRIIRIFPAYFFLLAVYLLAVFFKYFNISPTDWLSDVTFTKQFFINSSAPETEHLWSLSVEEMFYLLWPFFFIHQKRHTLSLVILFIIVCTFFRFYKFQHPESIWGFTILCRGDSLLIGCLFAMNYKKIVSVINAKNYVFFLITLLLFLSVISDTYIYHVISNRSAEKTPALNFQFIRSLTFVFFGQIGLFTNILIGLFVICSVEFTNIWFKFLNTSVMSYIGKLSYSLYLWQQVFTLDNVYLHKLPVVALVFAIVFMACISYYIIEKPFLRFKNKFYHINRSV